ncbi:MAG: FAD-dependent monooxygenase [Bacillota bacterium]
MIKLTNVKVPIGYTDADITRICASLLSTSTSNISTTKILKQSIDARKKDNITHVMTVAVGVKNERQASINNYDQYIPVKRRIRDLGLSKKSSSQKIIVVGSGPAGLFAGLLLSELGLNPTIIERGSAVEERTKCVEALKTFGVFNPNTNIQFGEGGAGTFSDGKLNTGTSSDLIGIVFGEFVTYGAPPEIESLARPHIGTDYLKVVVKNIRNRIIECGGKVLFDTKMTNIKTVGGRVSAIETEGANIGIMDCDHLLLGIGHSARDTFEMLSTKGISMVPKTFSIGVRIEHKQSEIDVAQYGKGAPKGLPPSDYKLSAKTVDGRGVYTFCMCPGGEVVPATSEEGAVVTNGMSNFNRDEQNANAAVLVNVTPEDFDSEHALAGVEFQRKWERKAFAVSNSYKAPVQTVGDLLKGKSSHKLGAVVPSYKPGVVCCDMRDILPKYVVNGIKQGINIFDRRIKGFASPHAVVTGVETRSSSPLRILRDENFVSNIAGIYPMGEGAGYAGGITSSAVDGLRVALSLYEKI